MKALWRRYALALLNAGCELTPDRSLKRKVMETNVGVLIALVSIAFYDALYIASGNPALLRGVWGALPSCAAFPLVWWLNARGRFVVARRLLLVWMPLHITMLVLVSQGTQFNVQLYFLVLAAVTPMFVPWAERATMATAVAINLVLFITFQLHGWPAAPGFEALGPELVGRFRATVYVTAALSFLIAVLVSERTAARHEAELHRQATTDALTRVLNRYAFMAALEREAAAAARTGQPLCIAMVDLDHFKAVNDRHGHLAGDAALRHVARMLRRTVRKSDWLARFGGEEFVVLMPGTGQALAEAAAERMRLAACQPGEARTGLATGLTVSIGVTQWQPGEPIEVTLRRADEALYQAKHQGRDRVVALP
ncbi:GGDEF domain-containing protein [Ideonella sp. BN130291]|uniref:GGDEF domain-containing protein n=1 Tax=Ideonella sp. BN130291 TaxID=3112940 RepID=UPI002E2622AC|nr:GGDEF domain-containing protein [Ideonella sp. BN130291]